MKLRYWYKVDQNKQPIPGSNIRRKSRPGPKHQWKEILDPCCDPITIDCTCGPRYFVQLDGRGKPVDGSLIKRVDQPRNSYPEGTDGMKFYELPWKDVCCASLTWDFNPVAQGSFSISINGDIVVEHINTLVGADGKIIPNVGDIITVTVSGSNSNSLVISGGNTFNQTITNTPVTFTFPWNVQNTTVVANIVAP